MNKKVDKIFNPLLFQIFILIATALVQVPLLHATFGSCIKYILFFGILVVGYQIVRKDLLNILKDKAGIAMLCFALSYMVSIAINFDNSLGSNVKQLIYMVVFFVLLFYTNKPNMKAVSITIVLITFVLSFLCFLINLFGVEEWYVIEEKYIIGNFLGYRLCGLYNPNCCGAITVISIVSSLYLLFSNKQSKKSNYLLILFVLVLNIILQYLVLILSASRGSFYGLLVTLIVSAFIWGAKNFKRENFGIVMRTLFAVSLSVILGISMLAASNYIQKNRNCFCLFTEVEKENAEYDTKLENFIEEIIRNYSSDSSALYGKIDAKKLSVGNSFSALLGRRSFDDLTGRALIWKSGFSAFLDKPLFGWTREGLIEPTINKIPSVTDNYTLAVSDGGLHNIYLTILCSSGIIGFICFVIAIGIILVGFAKRLLSKSTINNELLFSFAMCLYFLVSELVENRILYQVTFFNVVFWIFLGYLNYYSKNKMK